MTELIEHDRGLGTAYERVRFYELVERWATEYGIESAAEGPYDGMAGVPGVHLVGLARRGIPVVSALRTEEQARVARDIYESAGGGSASVRVVGHDGPSESLPASDLVISYHALEQVSDWRSYLASLAAKARKILVVTVCNPSNWGVLLIRGAARIRGVRGLEPPDAWRTGTLAPVLWELGRVREHVYFDCPWWPDLQVSPGQTLVDRSRRMLFGARAGMEFTARSGQLASQFVYGAGRWPYFGGPGWTDELEPALRRHPGFDGASERVARVTAHLHAFVVDVRKASG